jgi:DNA-directed RNA polymerase subunit RPC12/RpoP
MGNSVIFTCSKCGQENVGFREREKDTPNKCSNCGEITIVPKD